MTLPFPTPAAVAEVMQELAERGFEPGVELDERGRIKVWVRTGRIYATAFFHRRKGGFRPGGGRNELFIDGRGVCPAANLVQLRQVADDPDPYLAEHGRHSARGHTRATQPLAPQHKVQEAIHKRH